MENLLSNIKGIRYGINKDSDNDGLSDYHERLISKGKLRLGTGIPIGFLDPYNPDSDGDGLLDGEEIQIIETMEK